ncbi:Zinc finger protein 862 [Merluccius polli]|uniref:Zinc finger protein 862 n=1 Tax=Merluccius polli TaxID=89951 RepID=A0AA47NQX5_MERPO|nr:Zinc finger protein 862 [Merluccius polli]
MVRGRNKVWRERMGWQVEGRPKNTAHLDGTQIGVQTPTQGLALQNGFRICRTHKKSVKRGTQTRPFIEAPCVSYRKDKLDRHANSETHREALKRHVELMKGNTVVAAFDPLVSLEHEAIGQNTNYRSHRIIDDMLDILAAVIERPILQAIRTSQAVGLELDESTDVSVLRQLDIHVRYLDQEGKLCCHFLALVPIQDGKADSIVGAVREVVEKKEIPPHLICGLGTDGAAVMTGRINGVAKQLSEIWPGLLCTHCAAHRRALAGKDAADKVPYMKTFKEHLQQLHLYFRNSANRSAALSAAAAVLGITDLKVKEVKDTRWLSQHLAIQNLQKNISAVLNADVLPHLSRLSKIFQKEDLNFLAIKEQVPVTLAIIGHIKDAGDQQAPGSHLSRLNQSLDDPAGLGQFSISVEQERGRRGQPEGGDREHFWRRFRSEVMDPYLNGLIRGLEERFPNLEVFGSFSALGPQAATSPDHEAAHGHLRTLAEHFPSVDASIAVEEWMSFREHVVSGALKDKTQLGIMNDLTSKYEEFGVLYPNLCKLAAIALTVPLSSVNCERDFSTMNRVKTDLRNRLQGEHLEACMRISISGPSVQEFPYEEALKIFFRKPRKIKCSDNSCTMCH